MSGQSGVRGIRFRVKRSWGRPLRRIIYARGRGGGVGWRAIGRPGRHHAYHWSRPGPCQAACLGCGLGTSCSPGPCCAWAGPKGLDLMANYNECPVERMERDIYNPHRNLTVRVNVISVKSFDIPTPPPTSEANVAQPGSFAQVRTSDKGSELPTLQHT